MQNVYRILFGTVSCLQKKPDKYDVSKQQTIEHRIQQNNKLKHSLWDKALNNTLNTEETV